MKAPAKLTRSLRVVGRRDDGYHLIEAEMVSIDLCDELELSIAPDPAGPISVETVDEIEWCCGRLSGVTVPDGEANLVERALRAVGRSGSARLHKAIPLGAGLGGGSADAAAVLRLLGCRDLAVATSLGADVPFCLSGGRAIVCGIGELLEPLPYVETEMLLVSPPFPVSTPAVYAAWDRLGGPAGPHGNDLEEAALEVEPRLAWWRDLVAEAAGGVAEQPLLAGSGGTWWVEGHHDELLVLRERVTAAVRVAGETALVRLVRTVPGF